MPDRERKHTSRLDAFDHVAANLRQHWYQDGLNQVGHDWEDLPTLYKLSYLADFAVSMDVSFERYAQAARGVVGLKPGQQFTPDLEWFTSHEFYQKDRIYALHRAMDEMRINLHSEIDTGKITDAQRNRLIDGTAETGSYQEILRDTAARGGRSEDQERGMER